MDAHGASLLTPYNVVVSGNFADASTDVGGGLVVGGTATLNSFNIAGALDGETLTSLPSSATFVAAAGVSGEAGLAAGNYYFPGTDSTFYNNGSGSKLGSDPLTISSMFSTFTSLSNAWAAYGTTSGDSCTVNGTSTTCTVTKTGMNVINVSASAVASGQTLVIKGVSGADWLIINVTGTSGTLSGNMTIDGAGNGGDQSPAAAEDVLFNFYQAGSLTLGGSSMGSVLAPGAAVTGDGGQFVGSLVAASFTAGSSGGTEFHNYYFQGGTPEPATLAGVGVGLIALALALKRKLPGAHSPGGRA